VCTVQNKRPVSNILWDEFETVNFPGGGAETLTKELPTCIQLKILWYNRLCCAQDIHFPSPMITESLKPLGIFNTRVKQVLQISFTIDCKRGFISTQNFFKEIIINLQLMIAKSQNSMRALKSFPCCSWCSHRWHPVKYVAAQDSNNTWTTDSRPS
jgi:hypothetical protein